MFFKKKENKYKEEYKDYYLKIINLTKQYKKNMKPAINNLNFSVGPGEFHAFIGGNGAGKTTTIKSIVGAYAKYSGEIYFCGHLNTTMDGKRLIGYIPEIARFPENTSTKNYLINMALLSEVKHKDVKEIVEKILVDLNMQNLANKSPNTFSSGQKKKILLAQALIHDPKILIMDEPAANLDPRARMEFFDTLKVLQSKGKSIFISSHILDEIDKYASHATILDGGKIVFSQNLNKFREKNKKSIHFKFEKIDTSIKYFDSKKIKYIYDKERNIFIIELDDKKDYKKIIIEIINANLGMNYCKIGRPSLEEIFYKYVIKGSIHTMKDE